MKWRQPRDGEEAVVQFDPEQFDLVLLDLNLPLRNGWDVFERLTTRYPFVPVIIITGMPNQYRTALAAGASALMEKPIDVPALLKTMDELLAEPKEARLRRMCGYQQDTKHLRPPNADASGKLPLSAISSCQRRRPTWRVTLERRIEGGMTYASQIGIASDSAGVAVGRRFNP